MPTPFTTTWTGAGGDGIWDNPSNWSNGVPVNAAPLTTDQQDVAIIDNSVVAVPYTVTINGNDFVQDLTLDVTSGQTIPAISLTGVLDAAWGVSGGGADFGNIVLEAGNFEVDGGTLVIASVYESGGVLTFGNVATYGPALLDAVDINGDLNVDNGSDVVAAPSSFIGVSGSIAITQSSTLDLAGNAYFSGTAYVTSGLLLIDSGDFQSDPGTVDVEIGAAGTVVVTGSEQFENTLIDGNWSIQNSEDLAEIQGDTLTIEADGGASDATVTVGSGGTLDAQGTIDLTGTLDLTSGGTLFVEGVVNGGTVMDSDTGNGMVVIDPGSTATLNGVEIDTHIEMFGQNGGPAGTLLVTGDSTFGDGIGETIDLGGGTLLVDGALLLNNITLQNGVLLTADGGNVTAAGSSTITVQDTLGLGGTIDVNTGTLLFNGGTFQSDAGTTEIDVASGGSVIATSAALITEDTGDTLTFQSSDGSSPTMLLGDASTFDVQGTVNLLGTLELNSSGSTGGTLQVEGTINGGTVINDDSGNGTVVIDPIGTATLNGVTIATNIQLLASDGARTGTLVITGNSVFGDGSGTTVDLGGGILLVEGTLSLYDVTLQNGVVVVANGAALSPDASSQLNVSIPPVGTQFSSWSGEAGDGRYTSEGNWTGNTPFDPLALTSDQQDTATIDNSIETTPYTVHIDDQEFAQDLTLNAVNPAGGVAVSLTSDFEMEWNVGGSGGPQPGTIELQQGNFELDGGTLFAATVNQDGGTFSFGDVATYGTGTLDMVNFNGPVVFGNTSDVVIAPYSTISFAAGASITQSSTVSLQGTIALDGTVDVESGALSLDGGSLDDNGSDTTILLNGGTLLDTVNATLGNTTIDGNWSVAAGATITIDPNTTTTLELDGGNDPVTVTNNGTFDVLGTLDVLGTINGGVVLVQGTVENGTFSGGSLVVGAGTVALDNATIDSSVQSNNTATLVAEGETELGPGGTLDLGGGTLDVAGDLSLRGATLQNGSVQLEDGGNFNPGNNSTLNNLNIEGNSPTIQTTELIGQDVVLAAGLVLQPGDTLAVETGLDGTIASGTQGSFTVPGTAYLYGAGLVTVEDANGPSVAEINGGLIADDSGQPLHIEADTVFINANAEAINGATLELGNTGDAPAPSNNVYGGGFIAGQFSTILMDGVSAIEAIGAVVTLDGENSEIEANSGGTAVPIENTLTSVGGFNPDGFSNYLGDLNLLDGRGFAAQNPLTVIGTITLEGGTLSAPAISGTIYISPFGGETQIEVGSIIGNGVIDAPISGPIEVIASGGTLELTDPVSGATQLQAADNSTLIIDQPLAPSGDGNSTFLIPYNNAVIASYSTVAPTYIDFAGTNSIVYLVSVGGGTIGVQGTLSGDSIDLANVSALSGGVLNVQISRESQTEAEVVVTPTADPSSPIILDVTGDFSATGITAQDDGRGGTLIQFGSNANLAIPDIVNGNSLVKQVDGSFEFTTPVHAQRDTYAETYLLIYNTADGNPNQGSLSGTIESTSGPIIGGGTFTGLQPGLNTNQLPSDYSLGTGIYFFLSAGNAGLISATMTLGFTSQAPSSSTAQPAVSLLRDQTVTVEVPVWAYATPYFYQNTFYVQTTGTHAAQTFDIPVQNYVAPGYGEGMIVNTASYSYVASSVFAQTYYGIAQPPSGSTPLIPAGGTDTTSLQFSVDTDPNGYGISSLIQTGTIYYQVTSDGDGTSGLGLTNLGTFAAGVTVVYTQPATAYVQNPQIYYLPPTNITQYYTAYVPVYNTAPITANSEGLIATVVGASGQFPFTTGGGQFEQTGVIAAGGVSSGSLYYYPDTNPNDFADGLNEVQSGTVYLDFTSTGTGGIDSLAPTDLGTVAVPIAIAFDTPAIPRIYTNYYVHATAPNAIPSLTTVALAAANLAYPSATTEDLYLAMASSTGDFNTTNTGITQNPSGAVGPIVPYAYGATSITFQVVTDAAVLASEGNPSTESGTFHVNATSYLPSLPGYNYTLPQQVVTVSVTIQAYASPVIDGVADPIASQYNPTPGTPLHETIDLGTVYQGGTIDHIVQLQNLATAPADSLVVAGVPGGGQSAPIAPGGSLDYDGFIAHGGLPGFTTQTVQYTPISENSTSNTNLTPVDVEYTWTTLKPIQQAIAWGDVHLTTFDGISYSFQAEGEFVLAKSTQPGNNFQVQVRLEPLNPAMPVTLITDMGIQVGNDTITFEAGRTPLMYVDGAPSDISSANAIVPLSGGSVTLINGTYHIVWNTGESMDVTDSGSYLNIYNLTLGPNDGANSVEGLLGPANGGADDFQLANGSYLPLTDGTISQTDLYGTFAASWRVTQDTSLLDYTGGQTTATFTDVNFPEDFVSLTDLPSSVQSEALAAAANAGITNPVLQQQAALDYALTGSSDFLTSGANAQQSDDIATATTITESSPPPPALGVSAVVTSETVAASGVTGLTFDAYLVLPGSSDVEVDYTVTVPGAGYLGADAFGGTLPSGSVLITAGNTLVPINIDVPQGALGSDPTDSLQITITTPGSNFIAAPIAETELINDTPVAGSPAMPEIALLSGGTAVQNGDILSVALGDVVQGEAIGPLNFQITNGAPALSDNLTGMLLDSQLPFFTMQGTATLNPIAPGDDYRGLQVLVNTASVGAGTDTINYSPLDENASGYSAPLTGQTIAITDTIIAPAQPMLNTPGSLAFGDVHVDGTVTPAILSITNAATVGSANLDVQPYIETGGFNSSGEINQLSPGSTDVSSLSITENTASDGPHTGIAELVYTSDAGDGNTISAGVGTIELSGNVYALAQPGLLAPIYLHVNDPGTVALPLTNAAAPDGYSENLDASVVGTTGGVAVNGAVGPIAPQTTLTTATLTVPTSSAGTGSVTLDLISDGSGIDTLGTTDLGDVVQSVYVDNAAVPALGEIVSDNSTLIASGTTISLGDVPLDATDPMIQLDVSNVASGQADVLSGTFAFAGDPAFINAGPSSFSDLAAGGADYAPQISLPTTEPGIFTETVTLEATGSNPSGYSASLGTEELTITATVLCFLTNTMIATPSGEVPVQELQTGDIVVTASGKQRPIVWIGQGRVLATRGRRTAATPVIVRKGALADNIPHRDLHVTKGHALWFDGTLIPAEELVNHHSILWDDQAQEVTVYHIELDRHDVLLANGAPAESYRDDGNRWLFHNANAGWDLPQRAPCAPVVNDGPVVDAVWQKLLERTGPSRRLLLTNEPGLHLLADGKRIDAIERRADGTHVFRLGAKPRTVRLCSRAAVPQELGIARDPRRLGVALRRLIVASARRQSVVAADAASLINGYHDFEPVDGIRWTNGDAAVPSKLFATVSGPAILMVELGGGTQYLDEGDVRRVA